MLTNSLSPGRRSQRISLTPLIDIVFILLMFFMVTSTFERESQVPLNLSGESSSADNLLEPVFLRLHDDGSVDHWPDGPRWTDVLALEAFNVEPGRPVLLIPDEAVSLGAIVAVMTRLDSVGVVARLTDPVAEHEAP